MKSYDAPRWTYELLDCSMPMTFDTYNKCSYNCLYCFSFYQKSHRSVVQDEEKETFHCDYQHLPVEWVDVERIKKLFLLQRKTPFNEYVRARKVFQWGGLADPFDEYEKIHGKTLELMQFFHSIDYPISFSTKATWFTTDSRYMDLIAQHKHNWHFKVTITNLNEASAKSMEKGCPSPQMRLIALGELAKQGLHVTLRLRPFIIGFSNKDNEHLNLINQASLQGADSVSVEFFCLEMRADAWVKNRYAQMSKILGFNIWDFYKLHSLPRGYLRLNYNIKKPYIKEMKELCDKIGMRFYVSDAHHKEKSCNGSCCGLPESFNYSRGQFTEALMIAKKNGHVRFADIEPHLEMFKKILWQNSLNTQNCARRMKAGKITLFQFIQNKWNDPNNANSPYKYFNGVMFPSGVDDDGNVIYLYDYEKAGE